LLAGRAFTYRLFPLTYNELGPAFSLDVALQWGTLPNVIKLGSESLRSRFLQAYAETYLQEEIVAEQIVRSLPPFRRFLQVAAQANAAIVNFKKIADDCQTSASNVRNYYQILEDTLVGTFLDPFHQSLRKRQRQSPKFYWFDTGVVRALRLSLDATMERSTYDYGKLFETFVVNQIRAALDYRGKQYQLSYLLTKDGAEVDLIVERAGEPTLLLEIKSGSLVRDLELHNLRAFQSDIKNSQAACLYTGTERLLSQGIPVLPWLEGLKEFGL
jgi:predicted AAA+ superfamily ATPase